MPGLISADVNSTDAGSGSFVNNAAADATTTRAVPVVNACKTRARAEATFKCGWKPRYGSTCVDGKARTCSDTTASADPSSTPRKKQTSPTAVSISASVGTTSSTVPLESRLAAAATASARTGVDAPLRRRVGVCSPVSRMTPVSSERKARDGALDILSARPTTIFRAFYSRMILVTYVTAEITEPTELFLTPVPLSGTFAF